MVSPDQPADQHRATEPSDRFGRLFNLIGDAVVEIELVDTTPVVRSVNAGFESLFGYDRETVVGASLNEFIIPEGYDTEATSFDERTAVGKPNHAIVRRETATGVREFLYRGIPYEGENGRQFGFAIYSDITEQRTYERHIQVIHRLLRHNLRNELTVILGATEMLESDADREAVVERAAQIRSHAQNLASLGKEAQVLERVLTGGTEPRPLDLAPLCAQACQSVRETTADGSVTLDVPERLQVHGIPELETAIRALVENGVVHNAGEATVRVRTNWEPKRLVLEVADDGPGIPESERGPILGGDDITQLHHGTGLGLWLARCTVEVCDGTLEYERTDDGWTIVRLGLRPV
jgi:PAS domain S-box-containing protein